MDKKIIYVLEDDNNIQQLIKYNLESNHYDVYCFSTGKELFLGLSKLKPALLLLDIMLPDTDGYNILSKMKSDNYLKEIPIIMLTAKNDEFDKVLGLDMGCDDYVTKPFSIKELLARIKVVLKRYTPLQSPSSKKLIYKDLSLNSDNYEVFQNNKLIKLPLKEFKILEILMANQGKVFTRNQLLEKIWGYDYYGETRTVDVHIRYLRIHLNDQANNYIETIRGIGYKLKL